MRKMQKLVQDFHEKFGLSVQTKPNLPETKVLKLRDALIQEEAKEFTEAAAYGDMVGMADALADLTYVVLGAAVSLGIDLEPVFDEVHRSNMSKLWPDGKPHYSEAGKVLKPPSYSKANVFSELEKQGFKRNG